MLRRSPPTWGACRRKDSGIKQLNASRGNNDGELVRIVRGARALACHRRLFFLFVDLVEAEAETFGVGGRLPVPNRAHPVSQLKGGTLESRSRENFFLTEFQELNTCRIKMSRDKAVKLHALQRLMYALCIAIEFLPAGS